jgi:hypothetical protein
MTCTNCEVEALKELEVGGEVSGTYKHKHPSHPHINHSPSLHLPQLIGYLCPSSDGFDEGSGCNQVVSFSEYRKLTKPKPKPPVPTSAKPTSLSKPNSLSKPLVAVSKSPPPPPPPPPDEDDSGEFVGGQEGGEEGFLEAPSQMSQHEKDVNIAAMKAGTLEVKRQAVVSGKKDEKKENEGRRGGWRKRLGPYRTSHYFFPPASYNSYSFLSSYCQGSRVSVWTKVSKAVYGISFAILFHILEASAKLLKLIIIACF